MFKNFRLILLPTILILIIVYFVYHMFNGQRGLFTYLSLNKANQQSVHQVATLAKKKQQLELEVNLLRPQSLDLDLVEEKTKDILNMVGPNEIAVALT